jgi:hypothetical protein
MSIPDKEYWKNQLPVPYSPSDSDVDVYKQYCLHGNTLLLGCTHKLIPLSNIQMDIDPWYSAPTVVVKDWQHNNDFYENIIGDGVLNFTEELTHGILGMTSKFSKTFVARYFKYKLQNMRIANYFSDPFGLKPTEIVDRPEYCFLIWKY